MEKEPISGKTLHGHLETMVLSVLEEGEAHGFEVWRRLEAAGKGGLAVREGSLYPALYRLEKRGLVAAKWESDETKRKGPRRRIYRLTRKGTRQLEKGRVEWAFFVSVVGGVMGAPA